MQERYALAAQAAEKDAQSMELDEVLAYIRSIEDFSLGPMDAIRAQTEAIGDPTLPTGQQVAILQWLQDASSQWTEAFPLEEPLASELRKLLPVAAGLAITDEKFFLAGAHPLHQLLDTLHTSAVGWQPQLGRAGVALEQLVAKAVSDINAWFREEGGDLASICEELVAAADKDLVRAQRMTERLVETEKGRLRAASSRWKGAEMINRCLAVHQATAEIGEFLKGPWYESAQLVLLKFGADSSEWAQMSATTETLLDSLQINESSEADRRQHLFEVVTKIPKNVKHWLLSLHMDPQAVEDAVGLIETTHLSLLRQQPIALETIDPLHMEGMTANRTAGEELAKIESLQPGQWFSISEKKGEPLRAQLVLKLGQEQQLQFANKAGIKALQLSYDKFCTLLSSGNAVALRSGPSFSICLAAAAGIETAHDLEALIEKARPEQERIEAERLLRENEEQQRIEAEQEAQRVQAEIEEAARLKAEQEEAERLQAERDEAQRIQREKEEAQRLEREKAEAERIQHEREEAKREQHAQKEAERALHVKQEAERLMREQLEAERLQEEQRETERIAREQAEAQRRQAEREAQQVRTVEPEPTAVTPAPTSSAELDQEEADRQRIENYLRNKEARTQTPIETNMRSPAPATPAAMSPADAPQPPDPAQEGAEIQIQMGTWLGFHDGDTPMMAKLAVHDREQDSYIFVNREGIKMRSLNKAELLSLIENNLVDILEARSHFKDEVSQAKKNLE